MISSKAELKEYILQDSKANSRKTVKCRLMGDECWKFQVAMRKLDYYHTAAKKNPAAKPAYMFYKIRYHKMSVKLGFSIPYDVIGKGLAIPHYGNIIINTGCSIGINARIHSGVNIGASGGSKNAPQVGNNVYIGPGAKLAGDISVADGVCIGAGAVVVKSITEPDTTWGGVPAKKISDNSSRQHLSSMLFE